MTEKESVVVTEAEEPAAEPAVVQKPSFFSEKGTRPKPWDARSIQTTFRDPHRQAEQMLEVLRFILSNGVMSIKQACANVALTGRGETEKIILRLSESWQVTYEALSDLNAQTRIGKEVFKMRLQKIIPMFTQAVQVYQLLPVVTQDAMKEAFPTVDMPATIRETVRNITENEKWMKARRLPVIFRNPTEGDEDSGETHHVYIYHTDFHREYSLHIDDFDVLWNRERVRDVTEDEKHWDSNLEKGAWKVAYPRREKTEIGIPLGVLQFWGTQGEILDARQHFIVLDATPSKKENEHESVEYMGTLYRGRALNEYTLVPEEDIEALKSVLDKYSPRIVGETSQNIAALYRIAAFDTASDQRADHLSSAGLDEETMSKIKRIALKSGDGDEVSPDETSPPRDA